MVSGWLNPPPPSHGRGIVTAQREVVSQTRAFGRLQLVKEGDSLGGGEECHGNEAAVSTSLISTSVVEWSGRTRFGIVYLLHCGGSVSTGEGPEMSSANLEDELSARHISPRHSH